jgi:proline iminopeptidase
MPSTRLLLGAGALAAGALAARPRLMTWGATDEDVSRRLPGDGLIPGERDVTTMATTIAAPPAAIWPWLAQMGWSRGGWYSWDRLDHGGHPSADDVNPAWQHVAEGDRMSTVSDEQSWFDVAHVEPGRSLVLRASLDLRGRPFDPAGPRPRWYSDSRWEFFLDPQPDGTTRLLVRSGGTGVPRALLHLGGLAFWQPAHVIMQIRQFRQLRRRAEGLAARFAAGEPRHEVTAGVA